MDQSLRSKLMNEVLDIDGNEEPKLSSPPLRSISPSEATALSSALDPSELQKLSVFVTNLKKTFPEVFRVSGQPLDSFDAVATHDQVHGRDDLLGHRGRDGRGVAGGLRVDPQVVDQLEENVEGQTSSRLYTVKPLRSFGSM